MLCISKTMLCISFAENFVKYLQKKEQEHNITVSRVRQSHKVRYHTSFARGVVKQNFDGNFKREESMYQVFIFVSEVFTDIFWW